MSIPFEEPQPSFQVKDEGILEEEFPEKVAQQAQDALLELIKQLQVKTKLLIMLKHPSG
jgi:hypothetical protein